MGILISFLYLLLHIAVILLVAALILWALKWWGVAIDPFVYKCGQAVVVLLVIIACAVWLTDVFGYGSFLPYRIR